MIVPTMSYLEIYAEIQRDKGFLTQMKYRYGKDFGKFVLRQYRVPLHKTYIVHSKITSIDYQILFFVHRRSQWHCPLMLITTKVNLNNGAFLVLVQADMAIRIYIPHFFQRFNQREDFSETIGGAFANLDAQTRFILRNYDIEPMRMVEESLPKMDGPDAEIFRAKHEWMKYNAAEGYERKEFACKDGVCLCEVCKTCESLLVFNTFLSRNQLRLDQMFDFSTAYCHIHLRQLAHVYPNQEASWGKIWDDFYSDPTNTESEEKWFENYTAVFDKLEKEWPLPIIL